MWHEWGPAGTDEVPQQYLLQVMWTMGVTDLPCADLAVLIGGDDFRIYNFFRDPELEGHLFEAAEKWWRDHVVAGVPPRLDGSESASKWLADRFPREKEPLLRATSEIEQMVNTLREYEVQAEAATGRVDTVKNHLRAVIGEATGVEGLFGKITWKKSKDGERVDWEAVAKASGASQELIKRNTIIKPGPRVFRATWRDEK
jgi:predicted phage-related endonuclease